jgi:hypothetical protein
LLLLTGSNLTFQISNRLSLPTENNDMKINQPTLNKIEAILEEAGYVLRYERGNFQSGYCILQQRKVVVLNKFLTLEGRINTLTDLMPQLEITFDALTHESQKLYEELMAKPANE